MIGGKRREIGLGSFTDYSLAEAREEARRARQLIREGIDPAEERRARQAALTARRDRMTFKDAARAYLRIKEPEFRNPKHRQQWHATLESYAFPVMGSLPVDDVELRHVIDVLEPHWLTKTETMKRLRGRIESVLAWATVSGHRAGDNPARWKGHLDQVLPAPSKVSKVQHMRAMPFDDVPAFFADLRKRDGMAARALEFLILTAARSGEIRALPWAEIDMQRKLWTIPGERMKAGREHRVPLAEQALELLRELPRFDGSPLVFPAVRGGPMSDMTLAAVLKRMGVPYTVHGFRSSFRDWCAERTNYPRDVAEMALAHTIKSDTEAAYRRGDLLAKRHLLMRDWAKFCFRPMRAKRGDQVRALRGA